MNGRMLIERFDECARSWGWESDQGTGSYVDVSLRNYDDSKVALLSYVRDVEATLAMAEMHKDKL